MVACVSNGHYPGMGGLSIFLDDIVKTKFHLVPLIPLQNFHKSNSCTFQRCPLDGVAFNSVILEMPTPLIFNHDDWPTKSVDNQEITTFGIDGPKGVDVLNLEYLPQRYLSKKAVTIRSCAKPELQPAQQFVLALV